MHPRWYIGVATRRSDLVTGFVCMFCGSVSVGRPYRRIGEQNGNLRVSTTFLRLNLPFHVGHIRCFPAVKFGSTGVWSVGKHRGLELGTERVFHQTLAGAQCESFCPPHVELEPFRTLSGWPTFIGFCVQMPISRDQFFFPFLVDTCRRRVHHWCRSQTPRRRYIVEILSP
jgi:hypothetical protein